MIDDVYGFELVGGGVGIEYGQPVQMGIAERYGARQKDGDGNVAEDGDALGAAYVDEELESLLSTALPPSLRSTCSAKLAAVIAGCLVATVQCSIWMIIKPMP